MPISRTHRPRFFRDVTGQQHITETLRKEIASGMLGHAFLFSGPRGVGKTTTARILAKALLNERTEEGEPPAESAVSAEVDAGACIDLMELDAASHTGVEHVREAIIEHVRFAPARWKRKVYIIDECHMLSTSAWNALLKTLEEPPVYAYFILATTELHKVPETIVSRCQRFEFRRIAQEALTERIASIAKTEGVCIDDDVICAIVRVSDGCARDAESLFDQLASLDAKRITRDVASLVMPISRVPEIAALFRACLLRNVGSAIATGREIVDAGVPAMDVLNGMLSVVRALILSEDPTEAERLRKGDVGDQAIAGLIGMISRGELGDLALALIERRRDAKVGTDPQFALELALLAFAGGLLPHASTGDVGLAATPSASGGPAIAPAQAPSASTPLGTRKGTEEIKKNETKTAETTKEPPSNTAVAALAAQRSELVIDLNDLRILWNTVIREVEKVNRSIPFILKVAKPIAAEGGRITLGFAYDFHKEKIIDDLKIKRIVEEAIAAVLKCDRVVIDGRVGKPDAPAEAPQARDIVAKVLETFGGEIVA